jgi:hypothetical protein
VRTAEKWRKLELLAGYPKRKSGPKKGEASQGGKAGLRARRQADHDLAKLAQAQYEALVAARATGAGGAGREAGHGQPAENPPAPQAGSWLLHG